MINVQKALPEFKLDVAFALDAGITAIVGPTGAGKTTLLNIIAGLVHPDRGTIKIDSDIVYSSKPKTYVPPEKRKIGYVFQDACLFPHMNVRQNIFYGAPHLNGKFEEDCRSLIDHFDVGSLLERKPTSLSGGEKKRVAIVRALMNKPRLILLDEPLSGIDPKSREKFLPYLKAISEATTAPIIFVSHQRDEILNFASHIVVLDHGKVIKSGDAVKVLNSSAFSDYAGDGHAGTVLEGNVTETNRKLATLDCQGQIFHVSQHFPTSVGEKMRIFIDKQDIAIALSPPQDTSISNILPATIEHIVDAHVSEENETEKDVLLSVAGGNRLVATLTEQSVTRLKLAQNQKVFALIKAVKILQG